MNAREEQAGAAVEERDDEVTAVPVPVDPDAVAETEVDEERQPGAGGRMVTTVGAIVLIVGMFLTWYEIVRSNGFTEHTTGWQTFTNLRLLILAGAVFALVSVALQRTRPISLLRVLIGGVVAAAVIRRIVSPPDLPGATLTSQLGIYVALLGALGVAFGGLLDLDSGVRDEDEDEEPSDADLQLAALPATTGSGDDGEVVEVSDAEVVEEPELRSPGDGA